MQANHQDDPRDILTAKALTVPLRPDDMDPEILLSAATIIRQGGIVAHPTETFYGLAVDPFSRQAVERLGRVKGRVAPQGLILLLAHSGEALDLAHVTGIKKEWFETIARAFWPGPMTLVLPVKPRLSCPALAGGDTVAVRVSSHPVARQLARTVGRPITSTSANLSGGVPAASARGIDPCLAARLDLILDSGPVAGGAPSTILDLSRERPALLRLGPVTSDQIARVLGFRPRPAMKAA